MSSYKTLVGEKLICECVKYKEIPKPNISQMIINRGCRIIFSHKSKKRTGKPCLAYINSMVKLTNNEKGVYSAVDDEIKEISIKLKKKFNHDYEILFEGKILGNKLIGECSQIDKKKLIPGWSGAHGGQRIHFSCDKFAICYIEQLDTLSFTAKTR